MRCHYLAQGVALLLFPALPLLAATVDVGGGIEQFSWQEYDAAGAKTLKETGNRKYVGFAAENRVDERWTYGLRGRLYSGDMDCSGSTLSGTICSGTSVDYDGFMGIIDFKGRFLNTVGEVSNLALSFGFGAESWRRHTQGFGNTQHYDVTFGRLGLAYLPEQGLFGEAGTKYPFTANNKLDLNDGVTLTPQGSFSLYALVGYNFSQFWSIKGYYDSYRFKESDPEIMTSAGTIVGTVTSPESRQDQWGINIGLYF